MVPSDRVRRHGCVTPFPDCLLAIILAVRRKCLICSLVRLVSSLAVAKLARNKKISDSVINRRQRRLGRYIEGLPLERHNSTSVCLLSASPTKDFGNQRISEFPLFRLLPSALPGAAWRPSPSRAGAGQNRQGSDSNRALDLPARMFRWRKHRMTLAKDRR